MIRYLFTLVCFSLFSASTLNAQSIKAFSEDRAAYLSELETFMTASKRKVLEDAFKKYKKFFESGIFTDEEFAQIRQTSNDMLDQKMTASPYFQQYLECLQIIKNDEAGEARFKNWHEILDGILGDIQNRKVKPYKDFLAFSYDFYLQKALRYTKSGISWYGHSDKFNLQYRAGVPIVEYEEVDILGVRKNDTISINKTSGIYFPVEQMWRGEGGTVSWEKRGLENVYAELGKFEFEAKKSLYEVDSVKLYYPDYFPEGPIVGKFTDKVIVENKATTGSYPRFESNKKVLNIKNIGAGISYTGGFRLQGTTVYGYGSKDLPALLNLNEDGQKKFRAAAELFALRKGEQVGGDKVETTLYFDQDSIYHPSVNFKFNIAEKQMSLDRGKRSGTQTPFFDSYHVMNIDTKTMDWYMNENKVVIGKKSISFTKTIKKKANFESLKYFSLNEYERMQNISSVNPISIMKIVSEKEGDREFDAEYLAKKINPNYSIANAKSLYYDLVAKGFINYDEDNQRVYLKDKIFHYADSRQGKVDYDYLNITSETDSINAILYLDTKEIFTNAVQSLEFSAIQKVAAKPAGDQVIIKKNRDADFSGRVFAGYSTMQGNDFHFDYDKFQIKMDSIRYFDLFVPTGEEDDKGNKEALSLGSRIENLSGILLIDAPSNKSGKDDIPVFPSFQSEGPSYVYYDDEKIQGGRYSRDSFYFALDEFSFNALDNYLAEDVDFDGKMVSADIFPDFEETLVIQEEDQSLGFVHPVPEAGYSTYLDRGKYNGSVWLSNKGFLGQGQLQYLNAKIDSEDFIFRPKQMLCSAQTFDMTEDRKSNPEIPQVHGDSVRIDWRPYVDSMYVYSEGDPFELFKANEHTLDGRLVLTPNGVNGQGVFDWSEGQLRSKLMSFGAFSVKADTSQIRIKAFEGDALAFDTDNVNSTIDFDEEKGYFKGNNDDVITKMPYNQYQTTLNDFVWDMKEATVTFQTDEGQLGTFTSIHPDQDSLDFRGETALYKLRTSELKIGGVPFIQTSDAYVYPDSGDVQIFPGGVMAELQNAKIVCNTDNKYHTINKATVNVLGHKEYRAKGYYEYNIGDKEQEILFENIIGTRVGKGKRSEKKSVTRATGEIAEDNPFFIDEKTKFRGTISLNAESKNLDFEGFAQLQAPKLPRQDWFSINSEGDKNDLKIAFDVPRNYEGEVIRNGIYLSKESAIMYPSVMAPLYFTKDRAIIDTRGFFKYNKETDAFLFGDSTRIYDVSKKGNLMTFSNEDATVQTEGTYTLGSGLNNNISITTVGRLNTSFNQNIDTTNLNSVPDVAGEFMTGIMMEFPEKLKKIMLADIKPSAFDVDYIDYTKGSFYQTAIPQWLEDSQSGAVLQQLKNGFYELPKKTYDYTFLFGKVPMKWDFDYQSFVSTEEKNHLAYFNGQPVNKVLESYLEVKMPTNGDDRMYLFVRAPSEYYYFLGYKQGILNVVSNNLKFMEELTKMKPKDLIVKSKKNGEYEIQIVEPSTAQTFVSRVKAAASN